ncbi:aldolase [Panaeolus papilionaceus]|nr:aldolase [Panaeolus papilionaceus]
MHTESLHDFNLGPLLSSKGIIPGIRANGELTPIPRAEHEFIVQGLDGLLGKLQAARALGARFSKWRAPIACSSHIAGYPTSISLQIQAETLAQFAAISQQAGLVPIVEPDVDFSRDADLSKSVHVHETVIAMIYERMKAHGVLIEGTLLKPSFPQPGIRNPQRANVTAEEIALATATMLSRSVPIAVAGVLFLSGGLSSQTATSYLAALNKLVSNAPEKSPFRRLPQLSFSFGRAIQGDALKAWLKGDKEGMRTMLAKWSNVSADAVNGAV